MVPSLSAAEVDGDYCRTILSNCQPPTVNIFSESFKNCNHTLTFLVDTGSALSILPKEHRVDKLCKLHLRTANGTSMFTKGTTNIDFEIEGFTNSFSWNFQVADVLRPILGADFLGTNNFNVNCRTGVLSQTPLHIAHIFPIAQLSDNAHIEKLPDFVQQILPKFPHLTTRSLDRQDLPILYAHSITTIPTLPLRERVRPLSSEKLEAVRNEFTILEKEGIVNRSKSPWASPLHLVTKKDGSFRPCGDYRRLNKVTIHDSYPMPLIHDVLNRLSHANVFTTLDLTKAYHQIPVSDDDIPKTAVITPIGLFEYKFMPFGLRNAAQTFQRFIDQLLSSSSCALAYIDDIIIGSADIESHKRDVTEIFTILNQNKLQINLNKCVFFEREVKFLGHFISKDGVRPLPIRLETITNFPLPKTTSHLRSFLGTINYCHRFIPKVSEVLAPMSALCNRPKHAEVKWNESALNAFDMAKKALLKIQTLSFPKENLPFTLTTDASDIAIGAVLHQVNDEVSEPLEFFSKKLSTTQQRYSTFDRELLALHLALKHFRYLLEGRVFTIFTDHKPLIHLLDMKDPSPRQQRQISYISEFNCTVQHISGKDNIIADCLSRNVCAITHNPLFTSEILRGITLSTEEINDFGDKYVFHDGIHCDSALSGTFRPILPLNLRKQAFDAAHSLHHPGATATYQTLHSQVIWKGMRHDVKLWTSQCTLCQQHKITRHIKPPLMHFPTGNRFEILHIDIVGPLPIDNGYSYLLTMLDRKTRWFEVVPLKSISANIVANTLVSHWISRYGVPTTIISDRGAQFESDLFQNLCLSLGINHLSSTAYHPQTNGMLERFHRTLKASLRILTTNSNWTKALPFVLLGWRNTPSKTTLASPSQLLFGCNTSVPNELVDFNSTPTFEELDTARTHFLSLDSNPSFTTAHTYKPFIPKSLSTASHVWIRTISDSGLNPRYTGPHRIIELRENYAYILIDNIRQAVNLSRLKPAFGITEDININRPNTFASMIERTRAALVTSPNQLTTSSFRSDSPTTTPYILRNEINNETPASNLHHSDNVTDTDNNTLDTPATDSEDFPPLVYPGETNLSTCQTPHSILKKHVSIPFGRPSENTRSRTRRITWAQLPTPTSH